MGVPTAGDFNKWDGSSKFTNTDWDDNVDKTVEILAAGNYDLNVNQITAANYVGIPTGQFSTITAGENLTAGEIVRISGGQAFKADNTTEAGITAVVGVCATTVSSGNTVSIDFSYYDGFSSLSAGTTYYVGTSGTVTSTKPASNALVIGVAVSTTRINFEFSSSRELDNNQIDVDSASITTLVDVDSASITTLNDVDSASITTLNDVDSASIAKIPNDLIIEDATPSLTLLDTGSDAGQLQAINFNTSDGNYASIDAKTTDTAVGRINFSADGYRFSNRKLFHSNEKTITADTVTDMMSISIPGTSAYKACLVTVTSYRNTASGNIDTARKTFDILMNNNTITVRQTIDDIPATTAYNYITTSISSVVDNVRKLTFQIEVKHNATMVMTLEMYTVLGLTVDNL